MVVTIKKKSKEEILMDALGKHNHDELCSVRPFLLAAMEIYASQFQPPPDTEIDANKYFERHRIDLSGVFAGKYLDEEDFMKYVNYLHSQHQKELEELQREIDYWKEEWKCERLKSSGEPEAFIDCPSCGEEWNISKYNACSCGAHVIRTTKSNMIMNFDSIGKAMLIVYDELKNDKQSKALIKKIDTAKSDAAIRAGFKEAVKRLRELDKHAIADDVECKVKGFV